ncbi:hypothetical protein BUALT_Bualt08G0096400 [Buddleja alternifolia]|uniref:Uncharacterized protein n=1 Tax=Buddleja alternifolia TaxID=168488 RepID=A0AAV6X5G3_9LAMI|nr:hypothetical protein BUALT_Bualt08G0096400 [Buddleja alternifolia]
MATPQIHVRSISLPTSLHPTNVEVELQKLKSAFPKAVPILSSEAIQSGLVSLAKLYNSVEEITRSSSHNQDAAKSMKMYNPSNQLFVEIAWIPVSNQMSPRMVLREVSGITIAIFKGILGFLSCPIMAKTGGWSFVSKMMITKSMDYSVVNEVGCVDFALNSKAIDVQMVQKRLQNLDACVEGIEEGLERLFRQLVQCRVTLLNILTDL